MPWRRCSSMRLLKWLAAYSREIHEGYILSGGFQSSGPLSLLAWLTLSVTAHNCGLVKSLANACLWAVVQAAAPLFHALLKGTMWSISTSLAAVQVAPSYGEYQEPEVAAHAVLTTTSVPSRLRTVSLVLQVPEMVIQVGKRSRE